MCAPGTGITEDAIEKERLLQQVPYLQTVLYVMVGGGLVGRLFAEQPQDAYYDTRNPHPPYKIGKIEKARQALMLIAKRAGLDPQRLPRMPNWNNLGVF